MPSCRTEVITLQKWFDSGIQHCKSIRYELYSNNEAAEEILTFKYLNVCLNELLRQISLDCVERGTLLKVISLDNLKNKFNFFQKQLLCLFYFYLIGSYHEALRIII